VAGDETLTPAFWIYSHLAFVLLIASMLSRLMKYRPSLQSILLCLVIPAVIGVLPIRQTDVSGFVLGHMGTLSVSMMVLLIFQLLLSWRFVEAFSTAAWRNMNLFWFAIGMILYPAALGLFDEDMYSYGFQNTMSWCVLCVSIAAVICKYRILGISLALSVLAHQLKLQESRNLWDYMIDPWLWIAAAIVLIAGVCRRLFSSKQPNPGERQGVSPPSVQRNLPTET